MANFSSTQLQVLSVTWEDWEFNAARPNVLLYYVSPFIQGDTFYEVIAIDGNYIYVVTIYNAADITDFQTNYQSSAVEVTSLDAAIALANRTLSFGSVLMDTNGNPVVIQDNTLIPAQQGAVLVAGTDGINSHIVSTDTTGRLKIDLFDGSGNAIGSTGDALKVSIVGGGGGGGGGGSMVIVDSFGNVAVTKKDTAMPGMSSTVLVGGTDGVNARTILLAADGKQLNNIFDSSGNSLSSTTSALNVSLRDGAGNTISSNGGNLAVINRDAAGNVANITKDSVLPGTFSLVMAGASDGTNARAIASDASGRLKVDNFDASGNALNSTTNALNVSLRDGAGNTVSSTGGNLAIIPRDTAGNVAVVTKDAVLPGSTAIVLTGGTDGTNARTISVDAAGKQKIDIFDSMGNSLNSTSNALNVSLRDTAGGALISTLDALNVSLRDGAGTAINSVGNNLAIIIRDTAGNVGVTTKDAAMPVASAVVLTGGTDGVNARTIAVDTSGNQKVDLLDGSGNSINSTTNALNVSLRDGAGNTVSSTGGNLNTLVRDSAGNVAVVTKDAAMPVATATVLVGGTDGANSRTLATDASGRLKIDNFDGSGNALNSTTNALNVSLRDGAGTTLSSTTNALNVSLRDSAGTSITLSGGNLKTSIYDGAGNIAVGTKGSAFPGTAGVVIVGGTDGTNTQAIATDSSGRVKVDNFDGSGNSLSSTTNKLNIALSDGAGTSITSTGGALPVTNRDAAGNASVILQGAAVPGSLGTQVISGTDGSNIRAIAVDTSGRPKVDLFDGSGNAITSTAGGNSTRLLDVIVRDLFGLVADHVLQFGTLTTTATTANQAIITYTVPAGKDFLITGLSIGKSVDNAVDATPFRVRVGGSDKMVWAAENATNRHWNPAIGFPVKIATAADSVTVTVTPSAATSTIWNATLFGYLRSI